MAITVTAAQGGSTGASLLLRVFVITGAKAAASQTGGTANAAISSSNTFTTSISTTSGSNVYGGSSNNSNTSTSTGSNATIVDDVNDSTNTIRYVTFKSLNVTTGATTRGYTTSNTPSGSLALFEILASGTLAEDASAPAVASGSGTSATSVTTASFTPVGGALLVAIVSSNGGASVTTMTVSGGGLSWSAKAVNNPSGGDYAGVWIADGPSASAVPAGSVLAPPSWVVTTAGFARPTGAGHSR